MIIKYKIYYSTISSLWNIFRPKSQIGLQLPVARCKLVLVQAGTNSIGNWLEPLWSFVHTLLLLHCSAQIYVSAPTWSALTALRCGRKRLVYRYCSGVWTKLYRLPETRYMITITWHAASCIQLRTNLKCKVGASIMKLGTQMGLMPFSNVLSSSTLLCMFNLSTSL